MNYTDLFTYPNLVAVLVGFVFEVYFNLAAPPMSRTA